MGRTEKSKSRRSSKTRRIRQQGGSNGDNTGSPLFQEAYAITLDPNSKRYRDIDAYAKGANIQLKPWKGIVVKPEEKDSLPPQGVGTTNFKDRSGAVFNLGVIGVFLAHRALFRQIAEQSPTKMGTLIFEDDVEIPPDFYQKLGAIEKEIPADWDFIFLDKLYTVGKPVSEHVVKLDRDMTGYKNWGIWAYIVRNGSLKDKILPRMEHMIDVPDIQLAKFADVLNMYLVQPSLVRQDSRNAPHSLVTAIDVKNPPIK